MFIFICKSRIYPSLTFAGGRPVAPCCLTARGLSTRMMLRMPTFCEIPVTCQYDKTPVLEGMKVSGSEATGLAGGSCIMKEPIISSTRECSRGQCGNQISYHSFINIITDSISKKHLLNKSSPGTECGVTEFCTRRRVESSSPEL